ncbi:hypothetical protein Leryth_018115 [Lithospermum erythrorhizon]|nr:hypothetical protein Leryth_018115 [Lithospermum erythrorhizon]
MENCGKISSDDVISKIKDEGHFDKLRLNIIRKLKDNEELRMSIISTVKQSAVLNRPGAENMKPRQLSDAIHGEVGEKVMSQISDHLWGIIQSGDGMKTEITETVQSIYSQLLNPKGSENGESYLNSDRILDQKGLGTNVSAVTPAPAIDGTHSNYESDGPPAFAPSELCVEQPKQQKRMPSPNDVKAQDDYTVEVHRTTDVLDTKNVELNSLPLVSESMQPYDHSDEDLDVPPGFG